MPVFSLAACSVYCKRVMQIRILKDTHTHTTSQTHAVRVHTHIQCVGGRGGGQGGVVVVEVEERDSERDSEREIDSECVRVSVC